MIFKQFDGFEVTPTDTVEQTMSDAKAKINEIQASETGDIGWYINVIHPARKFFGIVTSDVMASEYPNLAQEIEIFNGDELATNIAEINARIVNSGNTYYVGAGEQFEEIADAIKYFEESVIATLPKDEYIDVILKDGYVMNKQVIIYGQNLSQVYLVNENPNVPIPVRVSDDAPFLISDSTCVGFYNASFSTNNFYPLFRVTRTKISPIDSHFEAPNTVFELKHDSVLTAYNLSVKGGKMFVLDYFSKVVEDNGSTSGDITVELKSDSVTQIIEARHKSLFMAEMNVKNASGNTLTDEVVEGKVFTDTTSEYIA
jgi:hypothetical protein